MRAKLRRDGRRKGYGDVMSEEGRRMVRSHAVVREVGDDNESMVDFGAPAKDGDGVSTMHLVDAVENVHGQTRPRRRVVMEKAKEYEKSLSLWREGKLDEALESFESFLTTSPQHSLGWISFSRLTMATKGFREARRVLFRGLNKASSVGMLLQALGLLEMREGNDLQGVVLLEESVRYFGSKADAEVATAPMIACDATKAITEDSGDAIGGGDPLMSNGDAMRYRWERARVLRWKVVQAARSRAITSLGADCGMRFRQVRSACRRRVANRRPDTQL